MAYATKNRDGPLGYGECLAQTMLQHFRKEDPAREHNEADEKKTRREESDIGWKLMCIPRNADIATRLAFAPSPGACAALSLTRARAG